MEIPVFLGKLYSRGRVEMNEDKDSGTDGNGVKKKQWVEDGQSKLRALLDPDPDRAEDELKEIRRRYTQHFEWKGCDDPGWLFDSMIDKIASRFSRGKIEITSDIRSFIRGAAQKTLAAWIRRKAMQERRHKVLTADIESSRPANPEQEFLLKERTRLIRDCFDHCFGKLKPDQLFLFEKYHLIEGSKAAQRAWLAKFLKVTRKVLVKRAKRIKDKLRACVGPCLEKYGITLKYQAREAH